MAQSHHKLYCRVFLVFLFLVTAVSSYGDEKPGFSLSESVSGFIENKGQIFNDKGKYAENVIAKTSGNNIEAYITTQGITYVFIKVDQEEKKERKENKIIGRWSRVDMVLENASIKKENVIFEELTSSGVINYYKETSTVTGINTYKKIIIKNIYPGIDWVLSSNGNNGLKYDFIIHPGGNCENISLLYKGDCEIKKESANEITIANNLGYLNEGRLYSYQKDTRKEISSSYIVKNNKVTFKVIDYDRSQVLIIDPPLTWGTYYGGNFADGPRDVYVDNNLNVYIAGYTFSTVFPTDSMAGAFYQGNSAGGSIDAFLLKFTSTGVRVWATFYGGSGVDRGKAIVTDAAGNVFFLGHTQSTDLPTQNPGGVYFQAANGGGYDAFILKFNSAGVRQWATYYGGSGSENDYNLFGGWGADVDPNGNVYFVGYTESANFPLTNLAGAYNQTVYGSNADAFILKFSNSGAPLWGTFFGGNGIDLGYEVATDLLGNVFITGHTQSGNLPLQNPLGGAYFQGALAGTSDIFIARFNSANALTWSTYYGGNFGDDGYGIDVDVYGNIYVAGTSSSTAGFFTQALAGAHNQAANAGSNDIVIMKFNTSAVCLWATYYGGTGDNRAYRLTTDLAGNVYVVGQTGNNFPTANPGGVFFQGVNAGSYDWCILQFTPANNIYWATYYGGGGGGSNDDWATGVTTDANGCVYIIGEALSPSGCATVDPGNGAYYQPIKNTSDEGVILKFCCTPPSVTVSGNTTVCPGDSATLTASGAVNYNWIPANGLSSSTGNSVRVSPSSTSTYTLVGINSTFCFDTSLVTVSLIPAPTLSVNGNMSLCTGDSTVISLSGATAYSWSPATGLSSTSSSVVTIHPTGSTTYTVVGDPGASCSDTLFINISVSSAPIAQITAPPSVCQGSTVALTASGGSSYSWSTGSTSAIITVAPTGSTVYTATAIIGSCSDTSSVTINVYPLPVVSVSPSQSVCAGDSVTLTVSGTSSYTWSPAGGLSATTGNSVVSTPTSLVAYTVTGSDGNGCTDTAIVTVAVSSIPIVSVSGTSLLCIGDSAVLTASGALNYSWSSGHTTSSISITPTLGSTSYTVTGIDANGCSALTVYQVSVNPLPVAQVNNDTIICVGNSITLSASGGTVYSWSTGSTASSFIITPSLSSLYTVTVSNGPCIDSNSINIIVIPLPGASAGADVTLLNGQTTVLSAGGNGNYSWTPSTGLSCNTCKFPVAMPTGTTTYYLTVTDTNGCVSYDTIIVFIDTICGEIFVPNAFSPNTDGSNDILYVYGNCIVKMIFTIYDRWGEIVFESRDISKGWNGLYRNKEMDTAVFSYLLKADLSNGSEIIKKGNVSLIK